MKEPAKIKKLITEQAVAASMLKKAATKYDWEQYNSGEYFGIVTSTGCFHYIDFMVHFFVNDGEIDGIRFDYVNDPQITDGVDTDISYAYNFELIKSIVKENINQYITL